MLGETHDLQGLRSPALVRTTIYVQSMRILRLPSKVTYVIVCIAGLFSFTYLIPASLVALGILFQLLILGVYLVGVRLFRGKDEDKVAPRAWWRFTGRTTTGFLMGAVLTLGTFIEAGGFLAHTTPAPVGIVAVLVSAFLAIAYFHSAYRLTKLQSLGGTT